MPAPKDYVKIQYPRKCEICEYVSNNPSMHHYHKKTHETIPEGKLCDGGCGELAVIIRTDGSYACAVKSNQCPNYLIKHSARVKAEWDDPKSNSRRENTKIEQMNTPEAKAKVRATLKKKWGDFTPDQMKDRRHYARRIRSRAQAWARAQGYELGQQTFHVDHKLSIFDAWKAGLSESVVNHPVNLQVIPSTENSRKGAKSSLTVDELMKLIEESKK